MSLQEHFIRTLVSDGTPRERTNNFAKTLELGVDASFFDEDHLKRSFEFINEFYLRYGSVPTIEVVQAELSVHFPGIPPENPFEYYLDSILKWHRKSTLVRLIQEAHTKNMAGDEEGRDSALIRAVTAASEGSNGPMQGSRLSTLGQNALADHMRIQRGEVTPGVKIGIPYIDEQTGGAQPGDLWVIAGASSSGKTFITCRCCMGAVLGRLPGPSTGQDTEWPRRKNLYISMEMSNNQIGVRDLALGSQVSGTHLRLGQLSHQGVQKAREFLRDWVESGHDDNLILVEGGLKMTVENIAALVKQHKPDVVFVDGAYLVGIGGNSRKPRWEVNMEVLENLKRLSMGEQIPIIATFQFDQKVKTKGIANIMGGQAIGQIASVVIGIGDYEAEVAGQPKHVMNKTLTILKGRSGESGEVAVTYDMNLAKIEEIRSSRSDAGDAEEFSEDTGFTPGDDGGATEQNPDPVSLDTL